MDFVNVDGMEMLKQKRGIARVCGDCWYKLRPTEYEPYTTDYYDTCAACGGFAYLHRVSWDEVDELKKEESYEYH